MAYPRLPRPAAQHVLRVLFAGTVLTQGIEKPADSPEPEASPLTAPAPPASRPAASPPALAPAPPAPSATAGTGQDVLQYLCSQQQEMWNSRSPMGLYFHQLNKGVHELPHQWAVALLALLIGCLCLWNGPRTWLALFTATVVGGATSLARIEAEAWGSDVVGELLLMFQAAFATGIAIQSGFDGFQVLFGTAIGFLCCYSCGEWARGLGQYVPGFAQLWYLIGTLSGGFVLTVWQQPVLVTLGPLVGGFLVSTSVECLAAKVVLAAGGSASNGPSMLPPLDIPWIDVATDLLFFTGPGALAANGGCALLAVIVYKLLDGDDRRLPAVLCLITWTLISGIIAGLFGSFWRMGASVLWVIFTALSAFRQLGMLQDWTAKSLTEIAQGWTAASIQFLMNQGPYSSIPSLRGEKSDLGKAYAPPHGLEEANHASCCFGLNR
uniref:DUF4203 domain-containing protein n=1 Tax=Alexandrium monilatum TaxID=311494 RepID=A0A7S4V8K7_9DINO